MEEKQIYGRAVVEFVRKCLPDFKIDKITYSDFLDIVAERSQHITLDRLSGGQLHIEKMMSISRINYYEMAKFLTTNAHFVNGNTDHVDMSAISLDIERKEGVKPAFSLAPLFYYIPEENSNPDDYDFYIIDY